VALVGGSLTAANAEPTGTIVTVRIPLITVEETA
jgi:hypothetical protein